MGPLLYHRPGPSCVVRARARLAFALALIPTAFATAAGCDACSRRGPIDAGADASIDASIDASEEAVAIDAGDAGEEELDGAVEDAGPTAEELRDQSKKLRCPDGMMKVVTVADAGPLRFCIDRWEAALIDKTTGIVLSPYYPPDKKLATFIEAAWDKERLKMGSEAAQARPLPPLPSFQKTNEVEPMAVSRPGVTPNGYLSGVFAKRACENAGKRLCAYAEWITACRGEQQRQFPYGDKYQQGACNIFRATHPAVVLHNSASIGHLDPRLNLVTDGDDDPLLRRTGATPLCKSEWDGDAAWDMNGNIDEWIDDEHGMFLGGFFSRSKRDGCDSRVSAHPNEYYDYSTGTRCCKDLP